jgi:hypothetical protein
MNHHISYLKSLLIQNNFLEYYFLNLKQKKLKERVYRFNASRKNLGIEIRISTRISIKEQNYEFVRKQKHVCKYQDVFHRNKRNELIKIKRTWSLQQAEMTLKCLKQ